METMSARILSFSCSAPCQSMPMAIALAARHNGLTPAEAIACATATPAALLGLTDRGRIEPGCRADLVLLRHTDERALAFEFGGDPTDLVVCCGQMIKMLKTVKEVGAINQAD